MLTAAQLAEVGRRVGGALGLDGELSRPRVLPDGHSGLTMAAELPGDGGGVVIKMTPPGREPRGRHDVLRQARILSALEGAADVLVPRVLLADDGDPPLFAMTRLAGHALEPVLAPPAELPEPDEVRARAHGATALLARLHAHAPAGLGLADSPLSLEDELERWARTWAAAPVELSERAGELERRLRVAIPAAEAPRVVHGDYRLGNVLCAGGDPTGIIDWEIWSLGDARIDLGWMLLFCDAGNYPGVGFQAPGMPSAAELVATYEAASGSTVRDLRWFDAFARYKSAGIQAHNIRRHREGRHVDPFMEGLVESTLVLVERGMELLS